MSGSRRLALIQWGGGIGGAEVLSVALALAFRRLGVAAEVVFVVSGEPLAERLEAADIPFSVLGFRRGRDVLRYPRRYAAGVARGGPDGAVLADCGFMGAALRLGGYRAPIVAVEHGALLRPPSSVGGRIARTLGRGSGALADHAEVGVSQFMVDRMRRGPHARRLCLVYNGIDPATFAPPDRPRAAGSDATRVGFAGRLIPGKGVDDAIRAVAQASKRRRMTLSIAGDGPERSRLESLAVTLGIEDHVEFRGMLRDLPGFWGGCDVAVAPSSEFVESFGMSTLEAMACAKPVVGTRNGATPELVDDGVTGTIVAPGDVNALAGALGTYGERPDLIRVHGTAGRARAIERFHIDESARAYERLFDRLTASAVTRGRV